MSSFQNPYIVNRDYIDAVEGSSLVVGGVSLPISKPFHKEVMAIFKKI